MVKNPPANAGDIRDKGSIPGSGRSAGEEHGNPFQYSFPENPMDRGAWWATVLRVAKSRTRLKCPTSATTLYHNQHLTARKQRKISKGDKERVIHKVRGKQESMGSGNIYRLHFKKYIGK